MPLHQRSLELAILGRLLQAPSHGYELRRHVNALLGHLHLVSFGSLYPALKRLARGGLICDCENGPERLIGSRSRRVYHLTPAGQDRLASELATIDDGAWADDDFGVRVSLFGLTAPASRLRLLHGRQDHARERLARIESGLVTNADRYAAELVRFAHDLIEREIDWLDQMIAAEQEAAGEAIRSGGNPTKER